MHVIAITNQKGGVGETTTSVNLSAGLAHAGHSILLVDMDSQGHAGKGLGIDVYRLNQTIADVLLTRQRKLDDVIVGV